MADNQDETQPQDAAAEPVAEVAEQPSAAVAEGTEEVAASSAEDTGNSEEAAPSSPDAAQGQEQAAAAGDEAMDAVANLENQLGQMLSNLDGMMNGSGESFSGASEAGPTAANIELLRDVMLNVKIELGRSSMYIEDILKLGEGSVVELEKLAGDPVDVFVNERLIARGEVLVLNDNFCVRINEIIAQD